MRTKVGAGVRVVMKVCYMKGGAVGRIGMEGMGCGCRVWHRVNVGVRAGV